MLGGFGLGLGASRGRLSQGSRTAVPRASQSLGGCSSKAGRAGTGTPARGLRQAIQSSHQLPAWVSVRCALPTA